MKRILVALPLNEEQCDRLHRAAPGTEMRITAQPEEEDILWADVVMGNVPVEIIRKNDHLEWFQSNFAGPDIYLQPGVLPEGCVDQRHRRLRTGHQRMDAGHVAGAVQGLVPLP